MKNAKELLLEFTAFSLRDLEKAAAMFGEDGAFEMPYLERLGVQGRYEGREEIEGFFKFVRGLVELILIEEGDGRCSLSYVRPSSLMVVEKNDALLDAAKQLDSKLEALATKVTRA